MKIVYAPEAIRNLETVKSPIMDKFSDAELANNVVAEIMQNVRNLGTFPMMGRTVAVSKKVDIGYRSLFCRHNYVFYRVDQDVVHIVRVLHEKQDFMRILFGIEEE